MYLSQLRVRQHRVIVRFDAKGMSVPSAAGVFLQACSFNPIDFKRRKGDLKALRPEKAFPVVTGYDGAGVIEAVGDGVSHLNIGDEVYTRVVHDTQGTAAEYCLSYGTVTALKPRSFSFEEAAAVPLAAMTALQMLRKAKFARGHKVPLLHPPVADCKPLALDDQCCRWPSGVHRFLLRLELAASATMRSRLPRRWAPRTWSPPRAVQRSSW